MSGEAILDMIQPLFALCINAHALILAEIRRLKPIPLSQWPFPRGFRTWVAPAYLSYVYSISRRAEEYASKWLKDHAVETCEIA